MKIMIIGGKTEHNESWEKIKEACKLNKKTLGVGHSTEKSIDINNQHLEDKNIGR